MGDLTRPEISTQIQPPNQIQTPIIESQPIIEQQPPRPGPTEQQPPKANLTEQQPKKINLTDQQPQRADLTEQQPQRANITDQQPQRADLTEQQPQRANITTQQPPKADLTEKQPDRADVPDLSEIDFIESLSPRMKRIYRTYGTFPKFMQQQMRLLQAQLDRAQKALYSDDPRALRAGAAAATRAYAMRDAIERDIKITDNALTVIENGIMNMDALQSLRESNPTLADSLIALVKAYVANEEFKKRFGARPEDPVSARAYDIQMNRRFRWELTRNGIDPVVFTSADMKNALKRLITLNTKNKVFADNLIKLLDQSEL
jgi:hypothetical protein